MATRTKDELTIIADAACETAITSLTAFDGVNRVDALRLPVRRMTRKNTFNATRPRTAATN
jgi:hypothetical protein